MKKAVPSTVSTRQRPEPMRSVIGLPSLTSPRTGPDVLTAPAADEDLDADDDTLLPLFLCCHPALTRRRSR
jgi:predicted RNA polymerase sigma factor